MNMADILQMSYSEMEALATAFDTASSNLESVYTGITTFLSDIESAISEWTTRSGDSGLAGNVGDAINQLNDVKNQTFETWQGDAADNFNGTTYPAIFDAMKNMETELRTFVTTLNNAKTVLDDNLSALQPTVKSGSETCAEDATWVRNYAQAHQEVG